MTMSAIETTPTLRQAISRANGGPEVSATWVAANRGAFRFVDVREPHELEGPLGAAEGAENIPLQRFLDNAFAMDCDQPVVIICRSGRRSSLAAAELEGAGFTRVASVEGGMLAWNVSVLDRHDVHAEERNANASNLHDAIYNINGVPEVSSDWVARNIGRVRLVDVRQPEELAGGRVLQAENVPLSWFGAQMQTWERDTPIVVMCRSGGRSARATLAMIQAGFTNVASMEGGIIGWSAAGHPCA